MATPLIFGVRRKATLLHHTEISPARIGVRKGRYMVDRRLERTRLRSERYNSIVIKLGLGDLKLGANRFDDERDDISPRYGRGPRRDEGFTDKYKGP
jgi:hypothetical protein